MTFVEGTSAVAFLAGRATFAATLGFLALGNLLDHEASVGYAASKGVPLARATVPLGSLLLLAGATGVLLGAYPALAAVAVAGFLLPVTPVMHDFWHEEGEARQAELAQFVKNVSLLGATLVVLALASLDWPYALGGSVLP